MGDSPKYVLIFKELVAPREDFTNVLAEIHGLLSFTRSIFASRSIGETFLYFCLHGAATAWILQNELDMPEATAYRAPKRLRSLGVIVPAIKAKKDKDSKGGPRPTVWSLEGAPKNEVARALMLHYHMISPKYMIAREVAQTILDDYITSRQITEITYREILIRVKEMRIPFRTPDIAQLAAQYLGEQGVKVWR